MNSIASQIQAEGLAEKPAYLAAMPTMPEWPAVGQRLIEGATTYRERTYRIVLGYRPLTLDLHVPDGDGPFPVAVYAHGGGFMVGTPVMGEWRPLLRMGIAVASIRYRLRAEAQHPYPAHDIAAAASWVRDHADEFQLDASRLIGVGSSAGAYLVDFAALALNREGENRKEGDANIFDAVISFYAPTDYLAIVEDAPDNAMEQPGTPTASESLYLGYVPSTRPDEAAAAALSSHVRADAPPFLVLHGDADTRVGVGQARRFYAALQDGGADARLIIVEGAQHIDPKFTDPSIVDAVSQFLQPLIRR